MLVLYKAIWRVSWKRQLFLIGLAIAIAALAAVPLEYQKDIINELTDQEIDRDKLFQMPGGVFAAILFNLDLKWLLGYGSGILGEDIIRLLWQRIFLNTTQGMAAAHTVTVTTMISVEAEELGKFTDDAFSQPVVQTGTLINVVGFIAATQPWLGIIAAAMILPQIVLVLATQVRVNRYVAERVRILRGANDQVTSDQIQALTDYILSEFDAI